MPFSRQWKLKCNPQRCICTRALSRMEVMNHILALRVTQRSNQLELMFWHQWRTHSWLAVLEVPQSLRWSSQSLQQHKIQSLMIFRVPCIKKKKKTPNFRAHKRCLKIISLVTTDIWVKASFWINTTPYFEIGIEKCHVKLFTIVRTWSEYDYEKFNWDVEGP